MDSPDSLFAHVIRTFAENEWPYEQIPGADVLETGFQSERILVDLHVQAFEEINAVSVVAQCPVVAQDPDHRIKIVEALMRVNGALTVGNFEMQWDTGETLFRATNIFPHNIFDPNIVSGLVEAAADEVDRITPYLDEIVSLSPEDLLSLDVQQLLAREDLLPPGNDEGGS